MAVFKSGPEQSFLWDITQLHLLRHKDTHGVDFYVAVFQKVHWTWVLVGFCQFVSSLDIPVKMES